MAIGNFSPQRTLGIANAQVSHAYLWMQEIMRDVRSRNAGTNYNAPIYQQQLVHSVEHNAGPMDASSDWGCKPASTESNNQFTIREVQSHSHLYGRRNSSQNGFSINGTTYTPTNYLLQVDASGNLVNPGQGHAQQNNGQLYYFGNEIETGFNKLLNPNKCANCWTPSTPETDCDPAFAITINLGGGLPPAASQCPATTTPYQVEPRSFARGYKKIRLRVNSLGRSHVMLAPSMINAADFQQNNSAQTFWLSFYDEVLKQGANSPTPPISVSDLGALHFHHYGSTPNPADPMSSIKDSTIVPLRQGIDRFRKEFVHATDPNAPLGVDALLTETGPNWDSNQPNVWSASFNNLRLGLSYLNTFLCWLTRNAKNDLKLGAGKEVYSALHNIASPPWTFDQNFQPQATQTRAHLNITNAGAGMAFSYNHEILNLGTGSDPLTSYGYGTAITKKISLQHSQQAGKQYFFSPFGACAAAWMQVGSDGTASFNTTEQAYDLSGGWAPSYASGNVGFMDIQLEVGWNTVLFPLMKQGGYVDPNTQFIVKWGSSNYQWGYFYAGEFPDSIQYTYSPSAFPSSVQPSNIYSAMIFPVLCKSSVKFSSQTPYRIRVSRTGGTGGALFLGRPIVLPVDCTWKTNM